MTHDGRDKPAEVTVPEGSTEARVMAEMRTTPFMRHGMISNSLAAQTVKCDGVVSTAVDVGDVLAEMAKRIGSGDLQPITDTLLAQGIMLDVTVTELMRRAWQNAGEYPDAFRSYMGLALKAQAQSRASLEALARIHQPREQVVRHIHVNEGGQAIVADQLTIGAPGGGAAAIADQSHAARAAGAGECAALPCPDPLGNGVPVPGRAREAAVQDARRDEARRAPRKRQRIQARDADG
jgi:hypothetical protein